MDNAASVYKEVGAGHPSRPLKFTHIFWWGSHCSKLYLCFYMYAMCHVLSSSCCRDCRDCQLFSFCLILQLSYLSIFRAVFHFVLNQSVYRLFINIVTHHYFKGRYLVLYLAMRMVLNLCISCITCCLSFPLPYYFSVDFV